ncbi:hypothetical protein K3495_g8566 [Podosphaera aphanis]|nr:hypothetical protein K3495_g8566 [Podosphaera aphanis]
MSGVHNPPQSHGPHAISSTGASNTAHANDQAGPNQPQHKRVYQACIPCRRRKVKCDLGSVDNPSDPPCVRCRRESKECFFSATRRKRKYEDACEALDRFECADDYAIRNGRKIHASSPARARQTSITAPAFTCASHTSYVDVPVVPGRPLTPGGSIGRAQPLRRPTQTREDSQEESEKARDLGTQLENLEAQEVMRQEVYGPYDALDLLYKAATDGPIQMGDTNKHRSPSILRNQRTSISSPQLPSPTMLNPAHHSRRTPDTQQNVRIDPNLSSESSTKTDRTQMPGYKEALKAWNRFRFVRAGWFTAAEAIDYIDYYYEYLSPLTPISPPTFQDPKTHPTLLTEEPVLTVTLLTIASRYHQIPDTGGHCRSYAIHEQLWTYLRGMIERCLWGQEAFGGRFYSASASGSEAQTSSTAPRRGLRKGRLRTLGTIESLMILTEWHPRALYFPPVDATDELMIPSHETIDAYCTDDEGTSYLPRTSRDVSRGVGGKRIESWLEPAWRSDRMCWMLLSTAMGLSYELGVFDDIEAMLSSSGETTRPEYEEKAYRLRALRIKRLLLMYVTQLAGRLGWTNMVRESLRPIDPFSSTRNHSKVDVRPSETDSTISSTFNYIPDLELDDQVIHCWAGITNAMRIGNETLFKSRQHTTQIIQDGSYVELLQAFQPLLRTWRIEFELFHLPPYLRHILSIEYEYLRIYVNSLSLQAVVERCANHTGFQSFVSGNGSSGATGASLSPETRNFYGKLPLARFGGLSTADQECVKEVVDGSRNLLKIVVEGLLPNNYLKHAPVRTYFRIISGAMFLLKTFALGASKRDVEVSIGLMDRAVDALRNCVVDDVHPGIRFADLLETLTSRLRCRFISATADPTPRETRHVSEINNLPQKESSSKPKETQVVHVSERPVPLDFPTTSDHSADAGISAASFDLNPLSSADLDSNVPFNHVSENGSIFNNEQTQDVFSRLVDWNTGDEVWYLPPGMAFFQTINDRAVAQTAEGVNVGGMDLLDFMALDPPELFANASVF